jgi:hypothetical protein
MNKKFMEYSVKSSYNSGFVESFMKKNDLLPKEFRFRRSALDLLLKQSNKKISDFVKDTYKPSEQKNKLAQISKILNPKPNAPKYFTENDLANDLAHWFNDFLQLDETVAPNFFVGNMVQIDCVGTLFGNGQIGMHKKNERHKINIHPKYASFMAVESKIGSSRGLMRLYVPKKNIDRNADNRFAIAQDKKTKIIWFGFLEPKSNGKYDILDKSYSTGKTIGQLAENINLAWSSEIKASYYPTIYNI